MKCKYCKKKINFEDWFVWNRTCVDCYNKIYETKKRLKQAAEEVKDFVRCKRDLI